MLDQPRKFHRPNIAQRLAVKNYLDELLVQNGSYREYPAGHTDATVASIVGPQVNAPWLNSTHVRYVRVGCFGLVRAQRRAQGVASNSSGSLEDRVAELEDRLNRLVAALGGL